MPPARRRPGLAALRSCQPSVSPGAGCSSELNPRIQRNGVPVVAGLCAALGPWAATTLSAQQPTPVSGEASCAECVITLDTIATLGTWDDSGIPVITPFSRVAVDHRGRFLITHLTYPAISVFARDGEFLGIVGRGVDRPGEPGNRAGASGNRPSAGGERVVEFDAIAHVNVGPRFIHVFDFRRGRMVLDQDYELVRTDRSLGQVLSSVVLDADQVALAVPAAEPATVGHQLHFIDLAGQLTHFGGDPPSGRSPQPQRFLVTGDDRNVWVVSQQANRLVRWDLEPTPAVTRIFDRTVEAFERHNPPTETWPRSLNVGSMLDEYGLWVAWQTPDPEWTERISPGGQIPEAPWQTVLDGWLDLIDPATGRTIARYHGDDALLGFANGSRYVVSYHEPDSGGSYIRLLEPRLSRVNSGM